jgi:hypothetical protein
MSIIKPGRLLALLLLVAVVIAAGLSGWISPGLAAAASVVSVGIVFNAIPTTLRVPFVAVEFDNTKAQQGPALLPYARS